MKKKQKTLLKILIFFFLIIQSSNIFSQEIIFKDGKKYVDADYCNEVIDKFNECHGLLETCRDNQKENIKVVEKIITEDKIIIETVEVENKKNIWKGRFQGVVAGSSAMTILILVLIIL